MNWNEVGPNLPTLSNPKRQGSNKASLPPHPHTRAWNESDLKLIKPRPPFITLARREQVFAIHSYQPPALYSTPELQKVFIRLPGGFPIQPTGPCGLSARIFAFVPTSAGDTCFLLQSDQCGLALTFHTEKTCQSSAQQTVDQTTSLPQCILLTSHTHAKTPTEGLSPKVPSQRSESSPSSPATSKLGPHCYSFS